MMLEIGLNPLGPNRSEITLGDTVILVSYKTPVAALIPGKGWVRSEKKWSVTTSRHVNAWLPDDAVVTEVPQDVLDALMEVE